MAGTTLNLSALIPYNMWRGGQSILILALSAWHLLLFVPSTLAVSPAEGKNGGSQQWSLRVDRVDAGDVLLDPSLKSALHKSVLRELAKTKSFKEVFLSSDPNATEIPDLLILKMTMQEHRPAGETRGATPGGAGVLGVVAEGFLRLSGWTAASGVNKLNARIHLYTREGRLVLDDVVEGDVGFTGDNSRAIHNLAHKVAVTLKRSTLPDPEMVASEQETASVSKYQVGTITAAQCHQAANDNASVTSCEVSVRVGNTAYGVLYAAPAGTDNVRYETGLSRATITPPGDR